MLLSGSPLPERARHTFYFAGFFALNIAVHSKITLHLIATVEPAGRTRTKHTIGRCLVDAVVPLQSTLSTAERCIDIAMGVQNQSMS